MLDEELVLEDDVEGALELLVAGLPGPDEGQHAVQDVRVGVGELLQGPGQRGLRRHSHLKNKVILRFPLIVKTLQTLL